MSILLSRLLGVSDHVGNDLGASALGHVGGGLDGHIGHGVGGSGLAGHLGGGHIGTGAAMTASAMKSASRRTERMASSLAGMP